MCEYVKPGQGWMLYEGLQGLAAVLQRAAREWVVRMVLNSNDSLQPFQLTILARYPLP